MQRVLLEALFPAMTTHSVDLGSFEPLTAAELGRVLARRNEAFRTRGIQVMLLAALVLRPLPGDVIARVEEAARELGVDDGMVAVARRFSEGSLGLAAADFERNGYTAGWNHEQQQALHVNTELAQPWDVSVHDPQLAERWAALGDLPEDTLGRSVFELYRARGFSFPGMPGSAPPLLAQHDWVHVLADFGTTVESELEVFAFIARANDDMRAFSLLAMVVSLFETGYLSTGAGLFEADPGHLSVGEGMAIRIADAMRRGALCHDTGTGRDSIDFLRIDWFAIADLDLEAARARFSVRPKDRAARAAGSVGPREPGGISVFQLRSDSSLPRPSTVPMSRSARASADLGCGADRHKGPGGSRSSRSRRAEPRGRRTTFGRRARSGTPSAGTPSDLRTHARFTGTADRRLPADDLELDAVGLVAGVRRAGPVAAGVGAVRCDDEVRARPGEPDVVPCPGLAGGHPRRALAVVAATGRDQQVRRIVPA